MRPFNSFYREKKSQQRIKLGTGRGGAQSLGRGQYLWGLPALGGLGLQVLADVPAGAEAPVRRLLVDLADVAVGLGGHIPGAGRGDRTPTLISGPSTGVQCSPSALRLLKCQCSRVQQTLTMRILPPYFGQSIVLGSFPANKYSF